MPNQTCSINHCMRRYLSRKYPWWRHQMEIFSALLAFCAGYSPVTDGFTTQRPVDESFDVFFDPRLDQQLSKQWRRWWFERPLWRHCNAESGTGVGGFPHDVWQLSADFNEFYRTIEIFFTLYYWWTLGNTCIFSGIPHILYYDKHKSVNGVEKMFLEHKCTTGLYTLHQE